MAVLTLQEVNSDARLLRPGYRRQLEHRHSSVTLDRH